MGIRGLESLMEKNIGFPVVCDVDIIQLSKQYKNPVVIIDGKGLLGYLYKSANLDWVCGGQMKELNEALARFIKKFSDNHIHIIFVFDGFVEAKKRQAWIKRLQEKNKKMYAVYNCLQQKTFVPNTEDLFILPYTLIYLIAKYNFKCEVYQTQVDADIEIVKLAKAKEAIGILAQDSDFVIYDMNCKYLSLKHLNFLTLKSKIYDSDKLASYLKIRKSQLPWFAVLCGNDCVDVKLLNDFHTRQISSCYFGKRMSYSHLIIYSVARYLEQNNDLDVNSYNTNFKEILLRHVPYLENHADVIFDGIKAYCNYGDKKKQNSLENSSEWKNTLNFIEGKVWICEMVNVLPIMTKQVFDSSICTNICMNDQLISPLNLWKRLRAAIYGILLYEKHKSSSDEQHCKNLVVSEWFMPNFFSSQTSADVRPSYPHEHPGLILLHTDQSVEMSELRWRLFASSISPHLSPEVLKKCPHDQIYLIATLFCMLHELVKPIIEEWEVKVFIYHHIKLQKIAIKTLEDLHIPHPDLRCLQLAMLYLRQPIHYLHAAIGFQNEVPINHFLPCNVFDGQLLQKIYLKAKKYRTEYNLTKSVDLPIKDEEKMFDANLNMIEEAKIIFDTVHRKQN